MANHTARLPNLAASGPTLGVQFAMANELAAAYTGLGYTPPTPLSATALVDTGASHTTVRQDIPLALGLHAAEQITVATPSTANIAYYQYFMRLILPNNLWWEGLVTAMPMEMGPIQCLIGRDILAHSVLTYVGQENLFTLSF